jgi:DNA-binding transcriptional regulator YiaG
VDVRTEQPSYVADMGPAVAGVVLVVPRWTGRETLALCQALRLNLRGFAAHLAVAATTVGKWEDPRRPTPPSLPMQAALDAALKHADVKPRTRFRLLMRARQFRIRHGSVEV